MRGGLSAALVSAIRGFASPPRRWLTVAITGSALAIAACGTSGTSSSHTGSGRSGFLAYSRCMRSHGVPNFPDPSDGGGIHLTPGVDPSSPAFQGAHAQCRKQLPGGGPPAGVSEQQKEQMVQTAQCMRAHGVTGFPDPTTTPPGNPQNYSIAEGLGGPNGGIFLFVPKTIDVNSPGFKQAAETCYFR
jgi:hypothetical protein